jgi:hypothetical protein
MIAALLNISKSFISTYSNLRKAQKGLMKKPEMERAL